jgi:hypothetical protein
VSGVSDPGDAQPGRNAARESHRLAPIEKDDFPIPANEGARLNVLADYNIMDSLPEQAYDDFARLASAICGTPIALITLLDEQRQFEMFAGRC